MNSRKLVNMFFKAFLIGGVVGLVARFIASWDLVSQYISPFDAFELFGLFLYFTGFALTFAVISLVGFLAYIFIHRFGEGMLRSFWPTVQIVLILLALFDIIYFSNKEISLNYRIIILAIVLVSAIVVAYIKWKQTNKRAIIPALFFMVVVTALELTLVLRTSDLDVIIPMTLTLIVANAYQIIVWYHVTKDDPEHTRRINRRRKEREKELRKLRAAERNKPAKKQGKNKGKKKGKKK